MHGRISERCRKIRGRTRISGTDVIVPDAGLTKTVIHFLISVATEVCDAIF
jgi:hypothetical protein